MEKDLRAQASAGNAVRLGAALLALDLLREAARPSVVSDEPQRGTPEWAARWAEIASVVPVDDEPRNPYPLDHPFADAWEAGRVVGFAAGRAAERAACIADLKAAVDDHATAEFWSGWRGAIRRLEAPDPLSVSPAPNKEDTDE